MAIIKCKMCGATLSPKENETIYKCDYCGTTQTISNTKDDKVVNAISRGVMLRNENEFDKAYNIYNQLILDGNEDPEIYWNLLLCRFGITYEDDYDGKKIPTINRMISTFILDDEDYKKVLSLADCVAKEMYIKEANYIQKLQTDIIKISKENSFYDIFICYKETDMIGERTEDSIIAQEIYDELVKKGYKVFLSRVSLDQSIGKNYEPYIYSALNSAKVMILIGTNEEYLNSVWVKNEWNRFLSFMVSDKEKCIIPCYKNIDPYDLPKAIRNFQGINLSKLGALQDLMQGINKIFNKTNDYDNNLKNFDKIGPLLKRCHLLLQQEEYQKAGTLADNILNENPECGEAYEILLLSQLKTDADSIKDKSIKLYDNNNFKFLCRYGDSNLVKRYEKINARYCEENYNKANILIEKNSIEDLENAKTFLSLIKDYKDSNQLYSKSEQLIIEKKFSNAMSFYNSCDFENPKDYKKIMDAIDKLYDLDNFNNSKDIANKAKDKLVSNIKRKASSFTGVKSEVFYTNEQHKASIINGNLSYTQIVLGTVIDANSFNMPIYKIQNMYIVKDYEKEQLFIEPYNGTPLDTKIMTIGNSVSCKNLLRMLLDCLHAIGNYEADSNNDVKRFIDAKVSVVTSATASGWCYIATCVYGTYDCPDLWRLRRYRDYYLYTSVFGRLFIKFYYFISPKLIKLFGNKIWFQKIITRVVERKLNEAIEMGFEDTPYDDPNY